MSLPPGLRFRPGPALRVVLVLALVGYFAFGALVLALRYWVIPRVGEYRQEIAQAVGQAVGLPVEIGALEGSWAGLRPRLRVHDVVLRGADGAPALHLSVVDGVLGWSSLIRLVPVFHRIELEGPRLQIQRETDGRLWVAGLPVEAEGPQGGFGDWVLAQGAVVVRNARLEWRDLLRGAPPLILEQVNLRLEKRRGSHSFGLQARPPAGLAGYLDLRGSFEGGTLDALTGGKGRLYLRLEGADLAAWRPWVDAPVPVAARGGVEAWLDLAQGRVTALDLNLALSEARIQLDPDLPELDMQALGGRLILADEAGSRSLEAHGLRLDTRDGMHVSPTDFRVEARSGSRVGGSLQVGRLDLAVLTWLASHVPLPAGVNQRLAAFDAAGAVDGVELEWTGPPGAPTSWRGRARFQGIGVRSWQSLPGVTGISGEVEGTDQDGRVKIDSQGVVMDLPAVFPESRLALAYLRADGGWRQRGDRLQILLDKAEFNNQDASGQATGNYLLAPDGPGVIDLSARLTRADGTAVWRYMPLVVNQDTREWLQRSIVGGTASDARLRLKGDLKDFPFVDGKGGGQFQVRSRISGARLDYAPGWPAIEGIDGELLFEGAMMKISADRGRIFGVALSRVTAVLPDLEAPEEIMTITGRAAGPTADFLRFVAESPVAERIQHFTDDMVAEGSGSLDLSLVMPLRRVVDTTVKGEYRFSANRLRVVESLPPIVDAGGRVVFTGVSLSVPEARGRLFGEPVTITGKTRPDGAVVFTAGGGVGPMAAQQAFGWPFLAHLSGVTPWRSEVVVQGRGASVKVESSLRGVSSSLPAPFNKSATAEWPLRVDLDLHGGGAQDRIRATLASLMSAEILGRSSPQGWRAERGAIGLQASPKLPEKGVALAVVLPELDVDRWRRMLTREGVAPGSGAMGDGPKDGLGLASISLQIGRMVAFDDDFHDVALRASAEDDGWKGSVKSRETEGDFRWRGAGEGALTARLSTLALGRDDKSRSSLGDVSDELPKRSLPALDVTIQQFSLGDKALGRLGLQAHNLNGAWHLDTVSVSNPDGVLNAKGLWRPGRSERTELDFRLETEDAGRFLTRLGYADALRRGKASLAGRLEWGGPPTAIDYASLSGKMKLEAESGQFRKLEPGVGRLLGVLSLQSLPRRITLDFRDVFSEGFAFDRISGSIAVAGGVMRTDDLEIRGPAARVVLSGSADVSRETQDLLVRVQPTLSESVAVGAAAGLLNPVAGVVAYLAQKVLADPIEKFFAFEYRVTGQWHDPKVEKISGLPGATPSPAR